MADGKWIPDLTPVMPLEEAARRVLTVRLDVVRQILPHALSEAERDPEHIHQLRVGTRRARAAIGIFAPCLTVKLFRSAKKHLRTIRQAAGAARDCDVFLEGLLTQSRRKPPELKPGFDFLLGVGVANRQAAQVHLEQSGLDAPLVFDQFVAELLAGLTPPADPASRMLIDLARPLITQLVEDLETAANGDLNDYQHLHQVRILGKKLRYAMEIFADCFPATFRDKIYPRVEQMQEILGDANDSHVAAGRLEALAARVSELPSIESRRVLPGLRWLLQYHQDRLPKQRELFLRWWKTWQKTDASDELRDLLGGTPNR